METYWHLSRGEIIVTCHEVKVLKRNVHLFNLYTHFMPSMYG